MKRDMDLIRLLLLKIEASEIPPGDSIVLVQSDKVEPWIEGYSRNEILYNLIQIADAGYLNSEARKSAGSTFLLSHISWEGHEFLDTIRDEEVWRKTKKVATSTGNFSFEVLKGIATEIATTTASAFIKAGLGLAG